MYRNLSMLVAVALLSGWGAAAQAQNPVANLDLPPGGNVTILANGNPVAAVNGLGLENGTTVAYLSGPSAQICYSLNNCCYTLDATNSTSHTVDSALASKCGGGIMANSGGGIMTNSVGGTTSWSTLLTAALGGMGVGYISSSANDDDKGAPQGSQSVVSASPNN